MVFLSQMTLNKQLIPFFIDYSLRESNRLICWPPCTHLERDITKESFHHFAIKIKVTFRGIGGVEEKCYCMNGSMELLNPSTSNQILDHRVFIISRGTLAHMIRSDSFFGFIHGLIQVAHCGLIAIKQAKNLY